MNRNKINAIIFGAGLMLYFLSRSLFGNEVFTIKYLLTSLVAGIASGTLFYFAMNTFNPFKKKED